MSKYEKIQKTFADLVERQETFINDCCEFTNFVFDRMADYFEWPRNYICFRRNEDAKYSDFKCQSYVVTLGQDGYIHFIVYFTFQRYNDPNHFYQILAPTKVKKFEESFIIEIGETGEYQFKTSEVEEMKRLYDNTFEKLKSHFDVPYFKFTVEDFLRETSTEDEVEEEDE